MGCTATDAAGNPAIIAGFQVTVSGAEEQVEDLQALVTAVVPPEGGDALSNKLESLESFLEDGKTKQACKKLEQFVDKVIKNKKLTPEDADALVAAATRIGAVLEC